MEKIKLNIFYIYLIILNGLFIVLRINSGVDGISRYGALSTMLFFLILIHLLFLFITKKYDYFVMLWLSFYFACPIIAPTFINIGSLGLLSGLFLPLMLLVSFDFKNKYFLIICALIVVSGLSILIMPSRNILSSLIGLTAPMIFLYFVMMKCKKVDIILYTTIFIAAINLPLSVYQMVARPDWGVLADWRSFRIMGNLFHPNSYSMYLLPIIILVYSKLREKFNVYYLLLFMALVFADIFTFSRIGLFTLVASLIVFEGILKSGLRLNGKKMLLVAGLFLAVFAYMTVESNLSHLSIESMGERTNIWKSIFPLIKDNLIFGNGLGSYELFRSDVVNSLSPHNSYIGIIFDIGLIGLVITLIFIIFLINDLLKNMKNSKDSNLNELGIAIIAGILIFAVTDSAPFSEVVALNAWILVGCCMIKIKNMGQAHEKN